MSHDEHLQFIDYARRSIRLTNERWSHILDHPEMEGQLDLIEETLRAPEVVITTRADTSVYVYHRYYPKTPVTSKYLLVAVKIVASDAFVLTAFFSSRQKRGETIWPG